MKVLLCERNFDGHRKTYLECLSKNEELDVYVFAPENVGVDQARFFKYNNLLDNKKIKTYIKWIKDINEIVKSNNIDIVHILDGDSIMRFLGLGFSTIRATRLIITYHHFFSGIYKRLSYKLMCFQNNRTVVVHTNSVKKEMENIGINNVVCCEYPVFNFYNISHKDKKICRKIFGLNENEIVIGIVGGLCNYKRILSFLAILQQCNLKFQLLIAGLPGDIELNDIIEVIKPYKERVKLVIRKLSDEEYEQAIMACDIIYCLYGKEFNGASGPLADGVCCQKIILSCKHGSLGEIVENNELGYCANVDDCNDVLNKTYMAIESAGKFQYSKKALIFMESLKPEYFLKKYYNVYLSNNVDLQKHE